ncbi:MAG TPA: MDR family MFS transporter [Roseiarcus sp.]|nr:MDR family MFS transporter [Roseiarcus sp.]
MSEASQSSSPAFIIQRRLVTAACMLAIFMAAVEATIVATAMPTIVAELGGFRLFSWVFAAYLLATAVSTPLYGRLADLHGRKPVFVVGAAIFLVGSAACGFTRNMLLLVIFRLIQGLGAGSVQSISTTIVGDIYGPHERARVQGWLSAVWGVAAIAGPTLGAFIVQHLHWAYVFWINIPIGIAAIAILILCLDETVPKRPHRIDILGSVLLMIGIGAILMAVVQARSLDAATLLAPLAGGTVALALLVVNERRAAEPVVPFRMWTSRVMASGNAGSLVLGALLMCVVAFLPTYIQGVMARSATVAGVILATHSVSWSTGSIISGRVMGATSYRTSGAIGALGLIAGTALLIGLDPSSTLPHLAVAAVLIGLGMGFCNQTFLVAIQSSVGWQERGIATASTLFSRTIGQSLGAALGGAILNFGVAHLVGDSDEALNRLLEPSRRAGIAADALPRLIEAITTSLHTIYIIAGVLAVLALAAAWLIPGRLRPSRGP